MSKTKIMMIAVCSTIALALVVLLVLIFVAYSSKVTALNGDEEEGIEGLETVVARAERLTNSQVYPCSESVKSINSNRTAIVEWIDDARAQMASGDRELAPTTSAAFKEFIAADAKRLCELPGVSDGFGFGSFKAYISEGKMPAETELTVLQRRWNDVATIVEILSACGTTDFIDVQLRDKVQPKEDESTVNNRVRRQKNRDKTAATQNEPVSYAYDFVFRANPSSLVKAINVLSSNQRFIVIDKFSFERVTDVIAEAMGVGEKKSENGIGIVRRNRRRAAEAAKETAAEKGDVVIDPSTAEPLKVMMSVTVYDFRTKETKVTDEGGVK